tara:strand:- start:129 stop:269 length:141 start_codon:yes stop_codon:yes gene_type:complete
MVQTAILISLQKLILLIEIKKKYLKEKKKICMGKRVKNKKKKKKFF